MGSVSFYRDDQACEAVDLSSFQKCLLAWVLLKKYYHYIVYRNESWMCRIQVMNLHILFALKPSYKFKVFGLSFWKIILRWKEQSESPPALFMCMNRDIFIYKKIQPLQTASELEWSDLSILAVALTVRLSQKSSKPALKKQSDKCMGDAVPEQEYLEDSGQILTEILGVFFCRLGMVIAVKSDAQNQTCFSCSGLKPLIWREERD